MLRSSTRPIAERFDSTVPPVAIQRPSAKPRANAPVAQKGLEPLVFTSPFDIHPRVAPAVAVPTPTPEQFAAEVALAQARALEAQPAPAPAAAPPQPTAPAPAPAEPAPVEPAPAEPASEPETKE